MCSLAGHCAPASVDEFEGPGHRRITPGACNLKTATASAPGGIPNHDGNHYLLIPVDQYGLPTMYVCGTTRSPWPLYCRVHSTSWRRNGMRPGFSPPVTSTSPSPSTTTTRPAAQHRPPDTCWTTSCCSCSLQTTASPTGPAPTWPTSPRSAGSPAAPAAAHLVNAAARRGFVPDIRHSTDDYVVTQTLVATGLGIALLPALALAAACDPRVSTVSLQRHPPRRVGVALPEHVPPGPASRALLRELERATRAS